MIGAFPSPDSLQMQSGHIGPGDHDGGKVSADKTSPHTHAKVGKGGSNLLWPTLLICDIECLVVYLPG